MSHQLFQSAVQRRLRASRRASYRRSLLDLHVNMLQAICDHQGKFINIFVGYPGFVHDSRVLKNGPIYNQGIYPPPERCLLGDGGYACLERPIRLLTPYREPVRDPVHAHYNAKHARARNIVERAFGMLKARWRCLFFKALEVSPTFVPKVVACCTILHNLCLADGDIVEPEAVGPEAGDNNNSPADRVDGC
ncbi:hypothetical protein ACEWY4_006155 [Coilia grayii]|uniref:DDE Tnp4 domain-containing protein n=1 Tax=Coilia grayii TaxID=363190 RepID=A0ABD1KDN5_9TELE